jgi:aryl-alcohol dehydrogenase-like predicted oxidoreductase
MEQPQYNMFAREKVEREFTGLYKDIGLGLTTWSPLDSGLLTGKYNDGIPAGSRLSLQGYDWLKERELTPEKIGKVKEIMAVASDLGCTPAQLAIAWCLKNPDVSTVITGASRPEQLIENLKSTEIVPKLTMEVIDRIEDVLGNKPEAQL